MKSLITLLLAIVIYLPSFAQDSIGNFRRAGDGIVWDCTFVDSLKSSRDIRQYFLLSDYLQDIREVNGIIVANVVKWKPNYKAAGYSYLNIPLYISRGGGFTGTIKVYPAENSYRVVFSNIVINANPSDQLFKTESQFNDLAYNFKKDKFRSAFSAGASILDEFFKSKFMIPN